VAPDLRHIDAFRRKALAISLKVLLMQDFQTAASVLQHRLPHSAKPHPRILPQRGICLKALLMQVFQTAASVLSHRLPHSAKPHPRFCLSEV
jgi:uncharacterized membrane protein